MVDASRLSGDTAITVAGADAADESEDDVSAVPARTFFFFLKRGGSGCFGVLDEKIEARTFPGIARIENDETASEELEVFSSLSWSGTV